MILLLTSEVVCDIYEVFTWCLTKYVTFVTTLLPVSSIIFFAIYLNWQQFLFCLSPKVFPDYHKFSLHRSLYHLSYLMYGQNQLAVFVCNIYTICRHESLRLEQSSADNIDTEKHKRAMETVIRAHTLLSMPILSIILSIIHERVQLKVNVHGFDILMDLSALSLI